MNYPLIGISLLSFILFIGIAPSSLADSDSNIITYFGKEGYSITYTNDWDIYYKTESVKESGWDLSIMGFTYSQDNANENGARFYAATVPQVFESTYYTDQEYLKAIIKDEEWFCNSKMIDWSDEFSTMDLPIPDPIDSFKCVEYNIVNSTSYFVNDKKYYLVQFDWKRSFEDGNLVDVSSVRLDIPSKNKTLVLFVEAPKSLWEEKRDMLYLLMDSFKVSDSVTSSQSFTNDTTTLPILQQYNAGIHTDDLVCKNPHLTISIRENGKPLCASKESIQQLGLEIYREPVSSEKLSVQKSTPSKQRILWIDSYDEDYLWSNGIQRGIEQTLEGTGMELVIHRMDTKRNQDEAFKQNAGREAFEIVQQTNPDIIIATDDNAQKYLVVPHLMNSGIPIVFAGVNWDASMYGYPTENITGMIEVKYMDDLYEEMKKYAKGDRLALISGDTFSAKKVSDFANEQFFDGAMKIVLVSTYDQFKEEFVQLQDDADMIIFENYSEMKGWDMDDAKEFVRDNSSIIIGATIDYMAPYATITIGGIPEEQGQWATQTALEIIKGTPPSDIPIVANHEKEIILNMDIAEHSGIVFSESLQNRADFTIVE